MPVSVQQQSVLFNNEFDSISRSLDSIDRAAQLGREFGITETSVAYGDSSPHPCLSEEQLAALREKFQNITISYDFFGANLGSAAGHNRLAVAGTSDFILVQNPDIVPSPRLLENLIAPFANKSIGFVEAKQLPIEHPKDYDEATGDTSWASTASAMVHRDTFERLSGFDADTFFLYCDDVDFSWRVREFGLRVIFQPSAVVFHDKRLSSEGAWQTTSTERYYSAEAALLLTHKWSRSDLTEHIVKDFLLTGDEFQKKAVTEFEHRKSANTLPAQRDPNHKIAQFINGNYAKHRYFL
ncbi:glycosyltransferase family 2 protein [Phyllobacterium bourgognense]|uniref:GT2 family glycosyltransferase n=1 Tax=Phyllobacterium bourgognense TaxID=314236 RepID=A0A368YIZ6_9HYPH|nr:glycosyltransferase family 2 protein [Phyllobacterium bourgognense]RCW80155.1 hypothetical protein C7476_115120 [Phyllobacterium bourgognense]